MLVMRAVFERLVVSHAASTKGALRADVEPLFRRHGNLWYLAFVASYQRVSHYYRENVFLAALLTVYGTSRRTELTQTSTRS